MFGFYGLEEDAGMLETGVGGVAAFGFVAHASAIGATGVGFGVVGARGVPVKCHGICVSKSGGSGGSAFMGCWVNSKGSRSRETSKLCHACLLV